MKYLETVPFIVLQIEPVELHEWMYAAKWINVTHVFVCFYIFIAKKQLQQSDNITNKHTSLVWEWFASIKSVQYQFWFLFHSVTFENFQLDIPKKWQRSAAHFFEDDNKQSVNAKNVSAPDTTPLRF